MSAKPKETTPSPLDLEPTELAALDEYMSKWLLLLTEGMKIQDEAELEPLLLLLTKQWLDDRKSVPAEGESAGVRLQMPEGIYNAKLLRHIKILEQHSWVGSRGYKGWQQSLLKNWEQSAKAQLATASEIKRMWRVQTLKDAKKPETPEEKITRFLNSIRGRLSKGDPVLESSLRPFQCAQFSDAVWLALTHPLGNDRREAMQMMTLGGAEDFLSWALFLQGQGLKEIIVPRVWLDALREQWTDWVRVDAREKAKRAIQGRQHDEKGRLKPTRRKGDKTFTSDHSKIFKKIDD